MTKCYKASQATDRCTFRVSGDRCRECTVCGPGLDRTGDNPVASGRSLGAHELPELGYPLIFPGGTGHLNYMEGSARLSEA